MLIDPFFKGKAKRLYAGVYQIHHWNFELMFRGTQNYELDYPLFGDFDCYGICDSPEQLLKKLPKEVTDSVTPYVISVVQLRKEDQQPGGWRWHKWGEYIGEQSPQCEYLLDEPLIEEVWTYHIYQLETSDPYDAVKISQIELHINTDAINIDSNGEKIDRIDFHEISGLVEPFGGSHAPDCPYRLGGECLCWRSDPEQNPEILEDT